MLTQHLPLIIVTLALGFSLLMLQRQLAAVREQLDGVVTVVNKKTLATNAAATPTPPPVTKPVARPVIEEIQPATDDVVAPVPPKPKSILKKGPTTSKPAE